MKEFLKVIFSGIGGTILGMFLQYFFVKPQSFTFVYDGKEIIVTESEYMEMVKDNRELKSELSALEKKFEEQQNELESKNAQENVTKTIENATEYWNNSEYIQALTTLKNCGLESDDITALYQNYSEEYSIAILAQVDGLIAERKYDEAKELLVESKGLVADRTALDNKLTEMDNNAPTKLSSLKISSSRTFDLNESASVEDSVGNKYPAGNVFLTRAEGEEGYGYATFYLGEKYTGLSGTIAVSDESENRDDIQLEGWIEIYAKTGEEYTHLYTSPMLSRMTNPIVIPEINLTDAEWLEIRYYNNGEYYSLAGGYHSLEVVLSNFVVYSD